MLKKYSNTAPISSTWFTFPKHLQKQPANGCFLPLIGEPNPHAHHYDINGSEAEQSTTRLRKSKGQMYAQEYMMRQEGDDA